VEASLSLLTLFRYSAINRLQRRDRHYALAGEGSPGSFLKEIIMGYGTGGLAC